MFGRVFGADRCRCRWRVVGVGVGGVLSVSVSVSVAFPSLACNFVCSNLSLGFPSSVAPMVRIGVGVVVVFSVSASVSVTLRRCRRRLRAQWVCNRVCSILNLALPSSGASWYGSCSVSVARFRCRCGCRHVGIAVATLVRTMGVHPRLLNLGHCPPKLGRAHGTDRCRCPSRLVGVGVRRANVRRTRFGIFACTVRTMVRNPKRKSMEQIVLVLTSKIVATRMVRPSSCAPPEHGTTAFGGNGGAQQHGHRHFHHQ